MSLTNKVRGDLPEEKKAKNEMDKTRHESPSDSKKLKELKGIIKH